MSNARQPYFTERIAESDLFSNALRTKNGTCLWVKRVNNGAFQYRHRI